jgi:hypothetical protein
MAMICYCWTIINTSFSSLMLLNYISFSSKLGTSTILNSLLHEPGDPGMPAALLQGY